MVIAELVIVASTHRSRCSSAVEGISRFWCIHTMDYHMAMRMNDLQLYTVMQVYLTNVCGVKDTTRKSTHCVIPIIRSTKTDKINLQSEVRIGGLW